MKNRHLLAQKMDFFYCNIQPKRQRIAKNEKMRLQVDLEFQRHEIKRLNKKYNVEMSSHTCVVEKLLLQNRKLENLKSFCSIVKKHTRQLPPALDSIQKS